MELKQELQKAFANINVLYLKTINFHYNIKGKTFLDTHILFEKQYELFLEWTDVVGELLIKEEWEVRPSLGWLKKYSTVQEAQSETSHVETISSQLQSFQQIKTDFTKLAKQDISVTIADAFTVILHEIDKSIWFMKALLA